MYCSRHRNKAGPPAFRREVTNSDFAGRNKKLKDRKYKVVESKWKRKRYGPPKRNVADNEQDNKFHRYGIEDEDDGLLLTSFDCPFFNFYYFLFFLHFFSFFLFVCLFVCLFLSTRGSKGEAGGGGGGRGGRQFCLRMYFNYTNRSDHIYIWLRAA